MFRSILCVFIGFVLMMILAMIYPFVIFNTFPDSFPTTEEMVAGTPVKISIGVNVLILLFDILTATFAGFFTAAIAVYNPIEHARTLATIILIMGALTLALTFGQEPVWYAICRLFGAPAGVYLGGVLRTKLPNYTKVETSE